MEDNLQILLYVAVWLLIAYSLRNFRKSPRYWRDSHE